jgi:hypothetical protein
MVNIVPPFFILLQREHAEIERDRIEAAGEDDARSALIYECAP